MTDYAKQAVAEVTQKIREIRESAGRTVVSTQDGDHFSFRVPGSSSASPAPRPERHGDKK
jgi:hypothetical protein